MYIYVSTSRVWVYTDIHTVINFHICIFSCPRIYSTRIGEGTRETNQERRKHSSGTEIYNFLSVQRTAGLLQDCSFFFVGVLWAKRAV